MLDMTLLLLVGFVPAWAALQLLERDARRRAAAGRTAMSPAAETALHWLIGALAMTAIFVLAALLVP